MDSHFGRIDTFVLFARKWEWMIAADSCRYNMWSRHFVDRTYYTIDRIDNGSQHHLKKKRRRATHKSVSAHSFSPFCSILVRCLRDHLVTHRKMLSANTKHSNDFQWVIYLRYAACRISMSHRRRRRRAMWRIRYLFIYETTMCTYLNSMRHGVFGGSDTDCEKRKNKNASKFICKTAF